MNGYAHPGPPPAPDFDLRAYLDNRRQEINRHLADILDNEPKGSPLIEAMTYSLMAGGKRLRPILCLASAEATGQADTAVRTAACALELIHTYSLIHDDLPAMDDDRLRRGKPTCHVVFGESTAILAGDALLTLAFDRLAATGGADHRSARVWLAVIQKISRAAGNRGMIEGQIRDMASENRRASVEALAAMHALKTGALIEASVYAGACLGGADPENIDRLCHYARDIGLAFQVIDDILNVEGDPAALGKAVGTDKNRRKSTYPKVLGMEKSKGFAQKLVNNALKAIDGFDNRSDPLRALAIYIVQRKR